MFQLIVAVISIALVAALAIASLYYGGQAFQKSSLKANVTTLVNAGQQVSGADALYKIDNSGVGAADMDDLTDDGEYLAAAPAISPAADGTSWTIALVDLNDTVTAGDTSDDTRVVTISVNDDSVSEICDQVAEQAGSTWTLGDAQFDGQFGCYGADAATTVFAFKL